MEILLNTILGIVFIIISVVLMVKEKNTASAIIKYLACYMYISLAYEAYEVIQSKPAELIFVALAIGCIGDIAFGFKPLADKYEKLVYYAGIVLYTAENILCIVMRFASVGNVAVAIIIGILLSAIALFFILKKKKTEPVDIICEALLLSTSIIAACICVGAELTTDAFSNMLFSIATVLMSISSIFHLLDKHNANDKTVFKVLDLIPRYLCQLIITLSLIFIYY